MTLWRAGRAVASLVAASLMIVGCGTAAPTANSTSARFHSSLPDVLSWQWYLGGGAVTPVPGVTLYDVDLFETSANQVAALHRGGARVVCYFSAGTAEAWRPDIARFSKSILGRPDPGWPGERFVDIRASSVLHPILNARLDACKAKGFDGVEADNIDTYELGSGTGYPLTARDQLRFNEWIATAAHARNLFVLQKNDGEQSSLLAPFFDGALSEDCIAQGVCALYAPYLAERKPLLAAEYTDTGSTRGNRCGRGGPGASIIIKHRNLDSWLVQCPAGPTS